MKIFALAERAYQLLSTSGNGLKHVLLLWFRITWGWKFFVSGRGKLLNHGDIVDYFSELGIPFPEFNAWFVGGVEAVGGILLIAGLASRPVGLVLAVTMLVAYIAESDDRQTLLSVFQDVEPFTTADPFFFLLTAVLVFAFGPGLVSLDRLISMWRSRRKDFPPEEPSTMPPAEPAGEPIQQSPE